MPEKYFLSSDPPPAGPAVAGDAFPSAPEPLHTAAERVLWSGHCAVAEYAFEEPASLPRWTLPEETEVVVTDERVLYRDPATMGTGELHWRWPQHLRVQPGNRDTGRSATVTQIQLVCAGPTDTYPALVFAGGDLTTVSDADRLANVLRQAIARYRVEHAGDLGVTAPQARMLSRLVIGPEFATYQGGEGQTVSLLGALQVQQQRPAAYEPTVEVPYMVPAPTSPYAPTPPYAAPDATPPRAAPDPSPPYAPAWPYESPAAASPASWGGPASAPTSPYAAPPAAPAWPYSRPATAPVSPYAAPAPVSPYAAPAPVSPYAAPADRGTAADSRPPADRGTGDADAARRWEAQPDLASRAAELAARVAMLVSGGTDLTRPADPQETETTNLSAYLDPSADERPTARLSNPIRERDGLSRAESVRRTAARLAGNAPRSRGPLPPRAADDEIGTPTRGGHRH